MNQTQPPSKRQHTGSQAPRRTTPSARKRPRLSQQGVIVVSIVAALAIALLIAGMSALVSWIGRTFGGDETDLEGTSATTAVSSESSEEAPVSETTSTVSTQSGQAKGKTTDEYAAFRPTIESWMNPAYMLADRYTPLEGDSQPAPLKEKYSDLFEEAEATDGTAGIYKGEGDSFRGLQVYFERMEDKQPLFMKHARQQAWPASLTKILTVLVMLEEIPNLHEEVQITAEMIDYVKAQNASTIGFVAGEMVDYMDLAYASILPSAGEAAYAIAVSIAGSEEDFAIKMNDLAQRIGMTRSHFTNSTGLHDDEQYSTAEDLAILLRYAWANETFQQIATSDGRFTRETPQHTDGLYMEHTILKVVKETLESDAFKVVGGKSGYTKVGGQAWATVTEDAEGKLYLCITLGSRTAEGQLQSPAYDTYRLMEGLAKWDGEVDHLYRNPSELQPFTEVTTQPERLPIPLDTWDVTDASESQTAEP